MSLQRGFNLLKRWQIYALLTLVLSLYGLLAWRSYSSIDRQLTESALSRRLSLAQLTAATLSEKFERLVDIGVSLSTRVQFRKLIAAGDWDGAGAILADVPENFPFIRRLFLTDPAGTETVDIPHRPGGIGKNFAHRDWYRGVSRRWEPYLSEIYTRTALPQLNVFAAAIPIKSGDGSILGILVLQMELQEFFNWAIGLDIGPGTTIYVVDGRGRLAFHPDFPAQGKLMDFASVSAVQETLRGNSGIETTFNAFEGEDYVSAYAPVQYGWGVVVQQPARLAFADKRTQLNGIILGYFLILVFTLLVIWLTARIMKHQRRMEQDRQVKAELERRVDERTAQLQATNRELESFSYSISHDLRSPLRAIEGFSTMLAEDYGAGLDQEGNRLLSVVRENTGKMNLLIDDLLAFSRLGRQAVKVADLDMDELVREVAEEIRNGPDAGRTRFHIQPLPGARGDRVLLRQVWSNLITNAVKYSSRAESPAVEIAGKLTAFETIYYIKDNGVGFDMEYYDKLFSVFQRLHRAEDFPGTGIGLAIVQRVVSRHGGRVWAEGKVNQGATFYFTLPREET